MSLVHIIFNRDNSLLKVFDLTTLRAEYEASGDAWGLVPGNDGEPPYGHNCPVAPGHYKLTRVQWFNPPIVSEGPAQIFVADLDQRDVTYLIANDKALEIGDNLSVCGLVGPIGGLAKYGRSQILIHGGGTRLGPHALDPRQPELCKTFGCTRMFNEDLVRLGTYLDPQIKSARIVILTIVGNSPPLAM